MFRREGRSYRRRATAVDAVLDRGEGIVDRAVVQVVAAGRGHVVIDRRGIADDARADCQSANDCQTPLKSHRVSCLSVAH